MKYVEIVASSSSGAVIRALADKVKALDIRFGPVGDDGMCVYRILVRDDHIQELLDTTRVIIGAQSTARIIVVPTEVVLPPPEPTAKTPEDIAIETREGLLSKVAANARLSRDLIALMALSTLVVAIGMIESNLAVVIGAMVIAPLLGPNLALAVGTALGDLKLIHTATRTLLIGILIAFVIAALVGFVWPGKFEIGAEIIARTDIGFDSVALALASGAAAALSLTTGLSSVLVGVMVAVALLPPAAAAGLLLGRGSFELSGDALLLLIANIVCINLAANLVFLMKGIHPRNGVDQARAQRVMLVNSIGWALMLTIILVIITLRS